MNKEIKSRPNVYMMPGPMHLFWTTGYYHLCKLIENSNVILIVYDNYRHNKLFTNVAHKLDIKKIVYIPESKFIIHRNYIYNSKLITTLNDFYPDEILLHSSFYVENLYLIYWSKRKNNKCIISIYQNARLPVSASTDFINKRSAAVSKFKSGHKWLPVRYCELYLQYKYRLKYFLEYTLIPYILLKNRLIPYVNIYTGQINLFTDYKIDKYIIYRESEIKYAKHWYGNDVEYVVAEHPVRNVDSLYLQYIVGENNSFKKNILLLPSYGHMESRILKGENSDDVISEVANTWISVLSRICQKYHKYNIKIKLHPVLRNDYRWAEIIKIIGSKHNIEVIDPSIPAETCILKSDVILADISSVLWWCGFLNNKIAYSFDLFKYKCGPEMKEVPGIKYITNINEI